MSNPLFEISDLHVSVEGKEVVKGISLNINHGEVHAIMGLNGSGKSTLANAIMGNPKYKITSGTVSLDGQELNNLSADERANRSF